MTPALGRVEAGEIVAFRLPQFGRLTEFRVKRLLRIFPNHSSHFETQLTSENAKVGGGKISFVDAIKALVTVCDMTHKPLYFDEKLESGGNSHEMIKIMARAGGRQI